MTEEYFDKIGSLLCRSYKGDTEDNSLSCFDYGIEDKFSSECGAWRVMFNDSPTKENMFDYMTIKNDFQTCFRIELRYRARRIKAEKNDPISAGAHPGWSLYNLQERYLKVRKLIQDNPKYSLLQKKTYMVLMSSGLLSAVIDEPTDEAFYNLFMKSNIAKQALKDRDMLLDYCWQNIMRGYA